MQRPRARIRRGPRAAWAPVVPVLVACLACASTPAEGPGRAAAPEAAPERPLGGEPSERADELRLLGIAALRRGSYEEAADYFERAVAIEKKPATVTPTACDALQGMAEAYLNLDRAAEAEEPARRAVACREQLYGPDHPQVGGSFLLTGGVYYRLSRLDEAVVAWEKALEIYVRSETLSDPEHAVVLANLGRAYLERGEVKKAEIAYVRLVALYERDIESGDEKLGMAWADLGVVYFSTGRTARAYDAFLKALRILEPQLGPEDPAVVQVRRNLTAAARRLRQRKPSP